MPLVGTGEIVAPAAAAGRGVGAFNVVQLEHATAIVAGAAAARAPVILQVSENCVRYHGSPGPVIAASLAAAREAPVPVAVHLDHATSADLVHTAVDLGVGSVMFDASPLPYDDNVAATAEIAAWCHARGVWVEAELGEVGGKDGVHAPGARTDPADAAAYVAATGVDALAVAVGTSHAMLTRDAVPDLGLIAELRRAVPVPLVLHGSSGVPDAALTAAVGHGMTKINIATRLNEVLTAEVRRALAAAPALVDPRRYLGPGRTAVAGEVARLLDVLRTGQDGPDQDVDGK
ncbi:class II fructose-bisphosphate aldolase [Actinomadura macrotermitis]|uniref:Putative fructose-bisphosphate aldolase n=1 Tax=Actinomadura macrotermitis TaxID=2585200 RepID=A0A7K0BSC7_9ACTN|nr:class II fructose-bisphosphate aldolase [Actinomadura macrotermitis]MQY04103.1 putative fructose-bisphosphate aldolase [Actinomadura macrotermitis]